MKNNTIADQQQRTQALDAKHSFIVQAPAGSGKTELLTQRFLVLLTTVKKPEEITALTFTRKAASEMRQRILAALQKAATEPEPRASHARTTWHLAKKALQQDANLNWQLLRNPNRLRIMTIDALCASITKQMPLLANFGANPTICTDPLPYYRLAAQNLLAYIEQDVSWQTALQRLLLHLDNHLQKCEKLFVEMLARRDQWLPTILHARQTRHKSDLHTVLTNNLADITSDCLQKIIKHAPNDLEADLMNCLRFAANNVSVDHPLAACRDLTAFPDPDIDNREAWLAFGKLLLTTQGSLRKTVDKRSGFPAASSAKNKIDKEQFAFYKEKIKFLLAELNEHPLFIEHLQALTICPPSYYDENQWQILTDLLELLPLLAAELRLIFTRHALVDFTEISQAALQALGHHHDPSELALRLDYQIKHLLIDEFQDTSLTQMQLIDRLTAGWEANDGRTVFLVGDPMQSIYRFRQAQVGLFLHAWHHGLDNVSLTPLKLCVNFRSQTGIVNWCNTTFEHVFPSIEELGSGAVTFSPATSNDSDSDESKIQWLASTDRFDEATQLIEQIKNLRQTYENETVAILVQTRNHLSSLLPLLKTNDIPYQAIEFDNLASKAIVNDLWSLTRALTHPADSTAWLSILRAPWCGLTLEDLYLIKQAEGKTVFEQSINAHASQCLSELGATRLHKLLAVVQEQLKNNQRTDLHRFVKQTWYLLGGPACLTDANALADADTFFSLLQTLCPNGLLDDFAYVEEKLGSLFANTDSEHENPLQIMTIHKSKGLEFDHVILPALDKGRNVSGTALLMWAERTRDNGQADLLLAPIRASDQSSDAISHYLRQLESQQEAFESGRLLYVAATRAKKGLYLSCLLNQKEDGSIQSPSKRSLLHLLWSSCESEVTSLLSENFQNSELSNEEEEDVHLFHRLATNWETPKVQLPHFQLHGENTNPKEGFLWQPETQKHIGTVLHRILEIISREGLKQWPADRLKAARSKFKILLLQSGIVSNEIENSIEIVETTLLGLHHCEHADWILNPLHHKAKSEWVINTVVNDKIDQLIIDRTFIDENNLRWIIDYKTTSPTEESLEDFLDAQKETHRKQLNRYAQALARYENNEMRCALYFPTIRAWIAWEFIGSKKTEKYM